VAATRAALGFGDTDCEGTYFESDDYVITSVDDNGIAVITVSGGSKADSPTGSYQLTAAGAWVKQ
jgi:hypothetical protein